MNALNIDQKYHYINFRMGNEKLAISVKRVVEIIQNRILTKVPNSSSYIKGVINFRGEIIPVIDMHKRFKMKMREDKAEGMILVVDIDSDHSSLLMGLLVDEVEGIIEFEYKDIQKTPDMGINFDPGFIDGIVDINSQFIFVLNVDKALNKNELTNGMIADPELII